MMDKRIDKRMWFEKLRASTAPASFYGPDEFICQSNKEMDLSYDNYSGSRIVSPGGSPMLLEEKASHRNPDFDKTVHDYELLKKEKEEADKAHTVELLSMRRVMADFTVTRDKIVVDLRSDIEKLTAQLNSFQEKEKSRAKMEETIIEQDARIRSLEESLTRATDMEAHSRIQLKAAEEAIADSKERIIALEKSMKAKESELLAKLKDSKEHIEQLESQINERGNDADELAEARHQVSILQTALAKADEEAKILEESSAAELLSLREQRDADQIRVEELSSKIEAEVRLLKEEHESDQLRIEELLSEITQIKAELSKAHEELHFKDDAIENAENIMAFLEQSKEEMQQKYEIQLAEKQKEINDLFVNQEELKHEIQGQKLIYEEKLKQSTFLSEILQKEKQELHLESMRHESRRNISFQPSKIMESASNITDFLFNCAALENVNDESVVGRTCRM